MKFSLRISTLKVLVSMKPAVVRTGIPLIWAENRFLFKETGQPIAPKLIICSIYNWSIGYVRSWQHPQKEMDYLWSVSEWSRTSNMVYHLHSEYSSLGEKNKHELRTAVLRRIAKLPVQVRSDEGAVKRSHCYVPFKRIYWSPSYSLCFPGWLLQITRDPPTY